ncbi:hypothetical protein [uncultured Roseobacter sp.]|uniref:hypothetical protein n=1 Tax=uncultured Roseobacter sp. TaxID=114847 RepID=UPI00260B9828|nr:hypothetical protein [uncultured Roseobacter sp.]
MRHILRSLCFALTITVSGPAISDDRQIVGEDAPAFLIAQNAWLAGEDLTALRQLAQLSQDGNAAAQILLAQIATRGNMHAHVTGEMSRAERIDLLRVPQGLSGKSWLTVAAQTEPLAAALLQVARIGEKPAAIATLIELGEVETALLAVSSISQPEYARDLLDVIAGLEHLLPDEAAQAFAWPLYAAQNKGATGHTGSARSIPRVRQDGTITLADRAWIMPTPREYFDFDGRFEEIARISGKVAPWTPVYRFCKDNCAASVDSCAAVGASMLFFSGPFGLRSPAQSIIPNDVYWASARMEGDLARAIPDLRYRGPENSDSGLPSLNICFWEKMSQAQVVHGYRVD